MDIRLKEGFKAARSLAGAFMRGVDELLFPDVGCGICGAEECDCLERIELIRPNACPVCGNHTHRRNLYGLCRKCRDREHYFDRNFSAAYYDGVIRSAILSLKYDDAIYHRKWLGTILYDKYLFERRWLKDVSVVTYIPISFTRLMTRGYNQARELAQVFTELSGLPLYPLLIRKKSTKKMNKLGVADRREEIRGSMKVNPRYLTRINQNSILIIDDIFTTGATMDEAARCLKEAGASSVYSLTVAARR